MAEWNNYRYHIEMMIAELRALRNGPRTDTRMYLSLDEVEAAHLDKILRAELSIIDRMLSSSAASH